MPEIKRMSLGEYKPHRQTYYEFVKERPHLIWDQGINWATIWCMTKEDLDTFNRELRNGASQENVSESVGLMSCNFARQIDLRGWYEHGAHKHPGVLEKNNMIKMIEEYSVSGKHTGIDASMYPTLLARLEAMEDIPDIGEYCVHFHL